MAATKTPKLRPRLLPQRCSILQITSPVFTPYGWLPLQYTADGANINPSLDIDAIPADARSLALIMEDLDNPNGPSVHWLAWNIPVIKHLREARPMEAEGANDLRIPGYFGPSPFSGTHRYRFTLYALDTLLELPEGSKATASRLLAAMEGHILGWGHITGLYKRK